ncbi:SSU ribosomal protein S6P [Alkalithermobacter thermoalcaliphilus JW-YL-7 = DSM 7308]|uniref:Small ribosomal subunit protein bS6 n=1 Tax=Alkalithermobacter thermoalcaliphilus JW-YL-7 = DSM 7308 TaxID=1121328 RepID=A0A150FT10_CLOPD|nr:30S ribosomal protein S6 [[Clostridium] paradoxum JW-YL-7 = DSM 7308]SHL09237.1 SSU ribosomal protein S6P [[Clostridium] paradoxum JW-YL-7 = DSM 7308]
MKKYELVYVVKPNTEEERRTSVLEKVKSIVSTNGQVEKVDEWGIKKLAYPIQKFTEGYYVLVNFTSDVDLPKEIDRNLKISEDVIRHMIVSVEE